MMSALLLCLVLLPQTGPVHADLHPEEADLYFEAGDLPGVWKAYEQAPLVRLLRDERAQALLAGLGAEIDPAPEKMLERALEEGLGGGEVDAWFDGLRSFSCSLSARPDAPGSQPISLAIIADFAEPAATEAARQALLAHAPSHEPLSGPLPGLELLRFPGDPPFEGWCAAVGPRLVLGAGSARAEDYVARTERRTMGLGAKESFRKGFAHFEPTNGANLFWFAQTRSLTDVLALQGGEAVERLLEFLGRLPPGLNPLAGERTVRAQLVGGRFVTEIFTRDPGPSAPHVLGGRPVELAWLEPVPENAMLVYSSALDGAALGQFLRSLLAHDEAGAARVAAIEQKLGFGPERVLQRLGPAFASYAFPLAGPALPETRMWIDCSDPDAFRGDLEAFVGALGETLPGFAVRTRPYKLKNKETGEKREVPVTTVTLPSDLMRFGPMLSVSPSFAAVGKKLVFALNSMDVKNELKRLYEGEGEPITGGANPLAARGFELEKDAQSVLVMDWAKLFASVLQMVKAFAGMSPELLPFEVSKLPPPELFTTYIRPTLHFSMPIAGGTYRRNEGSFGPETWAGLAAATLLGRREAAQSLTLEPSEPEDAAAPPPEPPGEEPKSE